MKQLLTIVLLLSLSLGLVQSDPPKYEPEYMSSSLDLTDSSSLVGESGSSFSRKYLPESGLVAGPSNEDDDDEKADADADADDENDDETASGLSDDESDSQEESDQDELPEGGSRSWLSNAWKGIKCIVGFCPGDPTPAPAPAPVQPQVVPSMQIQAPQQLSSWSIPPSGLMPARQDFGHPHLMGPRMRPFMRRRFGPHMGPRMRPFMRHRFGPNMRPRMGPFMRPRMGPNMPGGRSNRWRNEERDRNFFDDDSNDSSEYPGISRERIDSSRDAASQDDY